MTSIKFERRVKDLLKHKILKGYYFRKIHGYELDLQHPKTFSEKIFYKKKFGNIDAMALIADKVAVRDYVKEKVGEQYLIDIVGVYEHIDVECFESFPNSFVIKTNHGSGSSHIEIVQDKMNCDVEDIISKFELAKSLNKGSFDEVFYTKINRKILVEKYIGRKDTTPNDYKFHCFNSGKVFVQIDTNRYQGHSRAFYDENWKKLNIKIKPSIPDAGDIMKPNNFSEMLDIAKTLSADFDYIRVDLYNVEGKIYFGELTQTHGGGLEKFSSQDDDLLWGSYWELDLKNNWLYKVNNASKY
ncbi:MULTISPECIES: ATP-grasp fold amidoligase family protein [unclassified Vibrio]|uniref:ATP-grasp fold amidoligase family protein n=1 Tax=unclassified Vibrio TaxID=2614977 RepID=UPI002964DBB7|nr:MULTISPECIES: ATP-grasp fold amidoligase family protein [unclassified Vibrio]MDW1579752.1 ATP-grasp fold amidoligase family protein [Vibrio sp. Vb2897]MDW1585907.1 ATP-grasp fold amidoligase family protein [Vibrio sp. Vb2910]MDW1594796.1 ATP-grasp fold amidoligase family protein [Vibrio sp. Vb2911]MDW1638013.1 ATP-grasp fold amidoligase family protein [Vibrio sp. Vb2896]MDW1648316.1 ATP-grasp fold amidoligase family protein [Vibrio sp. Vb2912]